MSFRRILNMKNIGLEYSRLNTDMSGITAAFANTVIAPPTTIALTVGDLTGDQLRQFARFNSSASAVESTRLIYELFTSVGFIQPDPPTKIKYGGAEQLRRYELSHAFAVPGVRSLPISDIVRVVLSRPETRKDALEVDFLRRALHHRCAPGNLNKLSTICAAQPLHRWQIWRLAELTCAQGDATADMVEWLTANPDRAADLASEFTRSFGLF